MKNIIKKLKGKKVLSVLLALVMVLSVASPAFSPVFGIIAKAAAEDSVELAFDNLFIFEQWAGNTLSTTVIERGSGTIETDFAEGSFTLTNIDAGEVFTAFSMDKDNALNNEGYYTIDVEANTEYVFSYVAEGTGSAETFVSYFDASGKNIDIKSDVANKWSFTTPANADRIQVRFDNNTTNSSVTYKNIKICKANTATINDATVPTRKIYTAGSGTYGELPTPAARDGYVFAGWYTGENGTGKRIGADTNVLEVSTTVCSKWDIEVQSLELVYLPTKTEYTLGERLNTTGLVLKATVDSETANKVGCETTFNITSGYYCTPEYLTNYGTRTITANYGGKSVTFKVNVSQFNDTTLPVNDTTVPVKIANNEYTFTEPYNAGPFNRYEFTYTSDSYVKGVIDFGEDIEEFFLEPSDDGSFASYTNGFLRGVSQYYIESIKFTLLDNELGNFELKSVKTIADTVPSDPMQYYQNDEYKVGIDLSFGGVVSYIQDLKNNPVAVAYADGTGTKVNFKSQIDVTNATTINEAVNLINTNDRGRYVQQSYYGTDQPPFEMGDYNGVSWRYNPVQGGNIKGEASKVIDYKITKDSAGNVTEIYVKTRPLDWGKWSDEYAEREGLDKKYKESYNTPSYMESRYVFEDGMIKTYCRFVDYSGYPSSVARQELPAFYCVEPLNTLAYVSGGEAWSSSNEIKKETDLDFWGAEPEYTAVHPVDPYRTCTENWAAFMAGTDPNSYGIGVYSAGVTEFSVGTFPNKYKDDGTLASRHAVTSNPAVETPTSYIAPLDTMTFKSYNPIEYSYYITTGTAEQIRYDFETVGNPKIQEELKKGKIAVPETVYLTPSTGASTTGQYYVNNTLETNRYILTTEAVNNATAGKFQFYIPGAKSVKFSVSAVKGDATGDVTTAGVAENTAITPNTKGYFTADNLTMSLGNGLTAGQTAVAEWVFTATMEDGTECIYYAYTTVYSPNYHSVGATAESLYDRSWPNDDNHLDMAGWISGIHYVSNSNELAPFGASSGEDGSGAFKSEPLLSLTTPMTQQDWGSANNVTTSSDGKKYAREFYKSSGGSSEMQSPLGYLTVDTSRYTNINTIPNVYVGAELLKVDHNTSSDGNHIYSYYGGTNTTVTTGENNASTPSGWTQFTTLKDSGGTYSAMVASTLNSNTNLSTVQSVMKDANSGRSIRFYTRPNLAVSSSEYISLFTQAKMYSSKFANVFAAVKLTKVDKSALRDLVIECSGFNEKNYTTDSWEAFKKALQDAAHVLGNPGATGVSTVATALEEKIKGLQTYLYFDPNGGTLTDTGFGNKTALGVDDNGRGTTWTFPGDYCAFFSATRPGYTFKGWSYSADTHYSDTDNYFPVDGNLIYGGFNQQFYAVWEGSPYTIVFNSNGGSGSMGDLSAKYGEELRLTANAFTKEGAAFGGWNTKADGSGTAYADGSTVKTDSVLTNDTLTLYAQWIEPKKVNVTFDNLFDFGEFRDSIGTSEVSVEEVTDTGFTVKGVSATKNDAGDFNNDCNTAWSYYIAIQPGTTYIVSADITHTDNTPNEGDGNYEVFADIRDANYKHLSSGQTPVENCMDEGGHMKAINTGTFKFTTSSDAAYISLRFDPNDYQSVMTVNNIRVYEDKDITWGSSEVNRVVYSDGTYGELPPDPTREGYTFDGWMNEQNNNEWVKADSYVGHDSTVYLTSQWTPVIYTVNFSANGPDVASPKTQNPTYEDEITFPEALTWDDGVFMGWSFKADTDPYGNANIYAPNDKIKISEIPEEYKVDYTGKAPIIVHAVWKLNSDVVVNDTVVADFGQPVTISPYQMNDSGTFLYHASSMCTYDIVFADGTKVFNGSYGTFKVNDYTITYTPTSVMQGVDTAEIKATLTYKTSGYTQDFTSTITVAPASNMLYEEDGFVTYGDGQTYKAWSKEGSSSYTEKLYDKNIGIYNDQTLIDETPEEVHGYNGKYEGNYGFADGSYSKVTVTADNTGTTVKENMSDAATFTFTGTGFDLISACGTNTGIQLIKVKDSSGKLVDSYIIDTYLSDTSYMTTGDAGSLLHQVPILTYRTENHGTYTVEVTAAYLSFAQALKHTGSAAVFYASAPVVAGNGVEITTTTSTASSELINELEEMGVDMGDNVELIWMDDNSVLNGGTGATEIATTVPKNGLLSGYAQQYLSSSVTSLANYIDGFRVYNPLDGGDPVYNGETEQNNTYYNIVEEIGKTYSNNFKIIESGAVDFDFTSEAFKAFDYNGFRTNGGPSGEIYLKPNQAIAFTFTASTDGTPSKVMLGMRALTGPTEASVCTTDNINTPYSVPVNSATEMYYDVSEAGTVNNGVITIAIANTGSSVLAVNNLKLVDGVLNKSGTGETPAGSNDVIGGSSSVPVLPVAPVTPVTPDSEQNETGNIGNAPETDVDTENTVPENDADVEDNSEEDADNSVTTMFPGIPAPVASFLELLLEFISKLLGSFGF